MPTIIPKAYFCSKCKTEIKKKTCNCGTKTKPLPPYTVRFRWINEHGIEEHKRLTGEPPWQTQGAAQRGYEEWIAAHPSAQRTTAKTFDFLPLYEEYKSNLRATVKESSYMMYLQRFEGYIVPEFRNARVNEITPADILKWQNGLTNKGLSVGYRKSIRSAFNHFFSYLKIYSIANPFMLVKGFKSSAETKKEMNFWTKEEFDQFIACVDNPLYKTVFSFLYLTGCRKGEACALQWSDVDFNNCEVNVHATLSKATDKGREKNEGEMISPLYRLTTPKTDNSYRKILIPSKLVEYLKELKQLYPTSRFIFGGNAGFLSFNTLEHAFKRYVKISGVKKIHIHELRHSHASLLINTGLNQLSVIYVIANRLGDTVEMILKTYGHLFPSAQREILDRLEFDF